MPLNFLFLETSLIDSHRQPGLWDVTVCSCWITGQGPLPWSCQGWALLSGCPGVSPPRRAQHSVSGWERAPGCPCATHREQRAAADQTNTPLRAQDRVFPGETRFP